MKVFNLILIGILVCSLFLPISSLTADQKIDYKNYRQNVIKPQNTGPIAVVVFDDLHENDYTDGDMDKVIEDLEYLGFVTKFASSFDTWDKAVTAADILIITAPFEQITPSEITIVKKWFMNGSRNLLLASRGDFEDPKYQSLNNLLSELGSSMKVQDDNVYTSNQEAREIWYVESTNFDIANYSGIFTNVNVVNFFSPSSLTGEGDVLIYAEKQAYQTDQNDNPPTVIYDDVDDSTGGDIIPLSMIEEVGVGNETDRIITIGTTMWSDFDYGDPANDDPALFRNMMKYFVEKTLEIEDIIIDVPDQDAPRIKIDYPHNNAKLKGEVNLTVVAEDLYGISNYSILIDGTEVSTKSYYVWDTTQENDGDIQVTATVTDPSGNKASVLHHYEIDQDYNPKLNTNAKFMTYNIKQSGVFPEWLDVMKEENADVVVLVETGNFDNNDDKLLNSVTNELNSYFFDEIPYNSETMQEIPDDFDGISILSRFPIKSTEKLVSLEADDGLSVGISLPFLHSILEVEEFDLHVIGAHLSAGVDPEDKKAREEQQESVINYMDDLGNVPIVYMGDMNSEARSDNSQSVLGTEPIEMIVNPEHQHASEVHTFTDVYANLRPDEYKISYLTFPSRIDFIFVNQWMKDLISVSTIGDTFSSLDGSDHLPVDVYINLNGLSEYSSEEITNGFLNFEYTTLFLTGIMVMLITIKKRKINLSTR